MCHDEERITEDIFKFEIYLLTNLEAGAVTQSVSTVSLESRSNFNNHAQSCKIDNRAELRYTAEN